MALEELTCLLTLTVIGDVGTCLNVLTNGIIWNTAYLSVLFVLTVGWALLNKIQIGMMVGGFIMTFVGIGLLALEYLSVVSIMVSIIVCLSGIFLTLIMNRP